MLNRAVLLFFLFFALWLGFAPVVCFAMPTKIINDSSPVGFEAKRIDYNEEKQLVRASGNVLIQQDETILKADKVYYDLKKNKAYAVGNVSLLMPDGSVVFAENMEVEDNLKEALGKDMRLILADKTRIEAKEVAHKDKEGTVFNEASYSPCDVCSGDKALWSLSAERVERDVPNLEYRYYNAWLDFKGVPVLYTPYFSHPDPSVKRKSGFLLPSIGRDDYLGLKAIIPYFYVIDENQDFTFAPMITSKEGVLLAGTYRGRYEKGKLDFIGAVTFMDSKRDWRGYLSSDFEHNINKHWRFGADINYVSDDTFLRRYDIAEYNVPWLKNDVRLEGFGKKSYFALSGMFFQEVRSDVDNDTSPLLLPVMRYSYSGVPSSNRGYFSFDAYAAATSRNHGTSVQKINTETAWHLPYIGRLGDIYQLDVSLRADAYSIQDYIYNNRSYLDEFSGFKGRLFPQVSLEWRYPFIRAEKNSYQVLEPIVSVIWAPNGGNPDEIPNEDSVDFEFDYTNLFVRDRYAGYDRVESGSRVNYGLQWSIYGNTAGKVQAFIGQSYRFNVSDSDLLKDSGLGEKSSDYVGKVELSSPARGVGLTYQFRLKNGTFEPQRNELSFYLAKSFFRVSGYYLDRKGYVTEFATIPEAREIGLNLNLKLNKYWSFGIYETYNLLKNGGPIEAGGQLKYEDECFSLSTVVKRDYTEYQDYEGGLSIMFYVALKTLGQFKTGM